jgi:mono/diheme cytochrome c family protein
LVTEIPEHLLRRSKERRAALSGEEGAATAEAAAAVTETPAGSMPVPADAPSPEAAPGGGGAGAPSTGRPAVAEPEPAPRIGPTLTRIPIWIMPVLVGLPLWGLIYIGAFGARNVNNKDPVIVGGSIFAANCSSCHGANGEGGVGPKLNGGEVVQEWPKLADHITWVHTGGAPFVGGTIGALHIPVPANNVMPPFGTDHGGILSDLQIQQVVCYERVTFGNEKETAVNCPGFTG